jgi:hypothetical protein
MIEAVTGVRKQLAVRVEYNEIAGAIRLLPDAQGENWEEVVERADGEAQLIVSLIPGLETLSVWRILQRREIGSNALQYYLVVSSSG